MDHRRAVTKHINDILIQSWKLYCHRSLTYKTNGP